MSLRSIASNISTKAHNLADDVRDASSRNQKTGPEDTFIFTSRKGGNKANRGFGLHPVRGSIANGSDRSRGQRFVDLMSGSANSTGLFAKSIAKSVVSKTQEGAAKSQEVAANIRDAAAYAPAVRREDKGYGVHNTDADGNRVTDRTSIANNISDVVSGAKNIAVQSAKQKLVHIANSTDGSEIDRTVDGVDHTKKSWAKEQSVIMDENEIESEASIAHTRKIMDRMMRTENLEMTQELRTEFILWENENGPKNIKEFEKMVLARQDN